MKNEIKSNNQLNHQCGGKATPGRSEGAHRTVLQMHSFTAMMSLLDISSPHVSHDSCIKMASKTPKHAKKRNQIENKNPSIPRPSPAIPPPPPPFRFFLRLRRCRVNLDRRLSALALITSTLIPSSSSPGSGRCVGRAAMHVTGRSCISIHFLVGLMVSKLR